MVWVGGVARVWTWPRVVVLWGVWAEGVVDLVYFRQVFDGLCAGVLLVVLGFL